MSFRLTPPRNRAPRRIWNLSRSISLGVVLAVAVAVAIVGIVSSIQAESAARAEFTRSSSSIGALFAQGLGGAVKFKKEANLSESFDAFFATQGRHVSGLSAHGADGQVIASKGAPATDTALIAAALATGEPQIGQDGLTKVHIIRFGRKDQMVGAVQIRWSDEPLLADLASKQLSLGVAGLLTAIGFGAVSIALIHVLLSQPLNRLFGSMRRLNAGVSADIVGENRPDEIGALAREMRHLHRRSVEAAQIRSALDSSSACVMVIDADERVAYVSTALSDLVAQAGLAAAQEGERAGAILPEAVTRRLETLSDPETTHVNLAALRIEMTLNPILDQEGERIGSVVEWRDQTEELRLREQIESVAEAVCEGDFSKRVEIDRESGLGLVAQKLNVVSDRVEEFVDEIQHNAEALAEGDLIHRVSDRHRGRFADVAGSLQDAFKALNALIARIKSSEEVIQTTLERLESGSVDLSARAESQAASLEETSAGMEQMASSVAANATNAAEADGVAAGARDRADRGRSVVADAVHAMTEIEKSSQKVRDIITVIDGIAFQTNLLALNAAVEAARAGEAGKGFAVVASEVRTLAQNAAGAARDIAGLISASTQQVEGGVRLVNATGDALADVVEAIEQVSSMVGGIATASREQSEGVYGVNGALSEMDRLTQANAALAVETANNATRLRREAAEMRRLIDSFKLDETALSNPASSRAAA